MVGPRVDPPHAQYAGELIDSKVDVFFAVDSKAIQEARAHLDLPIVALDLESDPVASGFVKSLAQPGGNVTGLFFDFAEFSGSGWRSWANRAGPEECRRNQESATGKVHIDAATALAKQRGVTLEIIECAPRRPIEHGFQQRPTGRCRPSWS